MNEQELHLDFCEECFRMTNHIGDDCQKCKAKELKKFNLDIDDEEDEKHLRKNSNIRRQML